MNFRALWKDDNLFWEALVISLAAHFLLLHVGQLSFLKLNEKNTVEIDITNMGHLGMLGPAPQAAPAPPKPAAPAKEWVKPAPSQKVVPASIPTKPVAPPPEETPPPAPSSGTGTGEYGIGTGDGGENSLSRIPQLLNLSDLSSILRRFYPEEARAAGKEAVVVLDLHVDTEGHVRSTDLIRSGGRDFDAAAQKVAALLRFTPAFKGSQRVAVKMRQAIQFKLEN